MMTGRGRAFELRLIFLLLLQVLFGAIFLSYGVHSIDNSKNKCLTIEQSFAVEKLGGYYAKDEIECAKLLYYEENGKLAKLIGLPKEGYFLAKPKGKECWITVRANEDWMNNFDSVTGKATTEVKISGDYWIIATQELKQGLSECVINNSIQEKVRMEYFVDNYSENTNVFRLVLSGTCFIAIFSNLFIRYRRQKQLYIDDGDISWPSIIVNIIWLIVFGGCFFGGRLLL